MEKNLKFQWPDDSPEQITKTLDSFLAAESLPHAYLFIGSMDSSLVMAFAQKIIGQNIPGIDSVVFDAAEESGVEGIREVTQLASLMPVSAQRKVIVLQNMDHANPAMLNALLKSLEEPPKHAVFVLQSARPLLATVMSRCQVVNLPKTSKTASDEVNEALSLLENNRGKGLAEKLSIVGELADLKDEVLPQLLEHWMHKQTAELKTHPEKFKSVRVTMETIQALRSNFNKKMVLQNFVMTALD